MDHSALMTYTDYGALMIIVYVLLFKIFLKELPMSYLSKKYYLIGCKGAIRNFLELN